MSLEIVHAWPPNIEVLRKHFKIPDTGLVLFTLGPKLYQPNPFDIHPSLMAHEEVHSQRQAAAGDLELWWKAYIANPEFRFAEELPAHREEWRVIKEMIPQRVERRLWLKFFAERLSGSLYGNMVTFAEAKRSITRGIKD